ELEVKKDPTATKFTINTAEVNKHEKYLILCEIAWNQIDNELLNSKKCDVICFLYDQSDPNSFSKVLELHENVLSGVPCLFVATKADRPVVQQNCEVQPSMYCTLNNLPEPVPFTALTQVSLKKDVYDTLACMAVYPHLCNQKSQFFTLPMVVSLGVGTMFVAGGAFLLYRYLRPHRT
ncbi:mitochondrial Rho GTPase 1-A-like isoform X2, partial [Paramuricea clavata]